MSISKISISISKNSMKLSKLIPIKKPSKPPIVANNSMNSTFFYLCYRQITQFRIVNINLQRPLSKLLIRYVAVARKRTITF